MMKIKYKFIKTIPHDIESETLYVSCEYKIAVHKCFCGCGERVKTPFSPMDWRFIFDGETVSLHPSIGNWSLPCQSHYWIKNSRVEFAPKWTKKQIEKNRKQNNLSRKRKSSMRKKIKNFLSFKFKNKTK